MHSIGPFDNLENCDQQYRPFLSNSHQDIGINISL